MAFGASFFTVVDLGSNPRENILFVRGCGVAFVRPRGTTVQSLRAREQFVTTNQQNEINLHIYFSFQDYLIIYREKSKLYESLDQPEVLAVTRARVKLVKV